LIPVIAIVGRPNVGKSTLFNCLTASRNALVSDLPGMTRDRQYGEATIGKHHFIVIDTGGLTEEKENLSQLTVEQALLAIQEADKILFVVDGRTGCTPADLNIAHQLRTTQKPIYLVVNKTEHLESELVTADFFQCGLGAPIAIAAAHKSGISELINTVFAEEEAPLLPLSDHESGIKLAIIGRPNVGKSTLINRLLGEERVIVFDHPGTTRDSIFIPLQRHEQRYTLIDTAGVRRRGKVFEAVEKFSVVKTLQAVAAANVVLLVMDAREGVTDQDLKLLGFILDCGKALVIAMNKWDGMTTADRDKTRTTIDRRFKFIPFVRVHTISALHGSGVGNLFDSINEAYTSATKKLSTPELSKILEKSIQMHTPPLVRGRRIKLRYAHAGGQNPPTIVIHGNQVKALPDAYKRYLANTFQERLKLIGTPIRIELKNSDNPFKNKKNVLTEKQQRKRTRMMKRVKKQK